MAISKSLALANESVLAVTSVPFKVGFTAAGEAPGSSNNVAPPVLNPPPLMRTSPPLTSCTLVLAGRVMVCETVMLPLLALPMMRVPVVIWSNSVSLKPSGPAMVFELVPRLICTLLVYGRRVVLAVPCVLTVLPKFMLLAMRVMLPPLVAVVIAAELALLMPILFELPPSIPVMLTLPPPEVIWVLGSLR